MVSNWGVAASGVPRALCGADCWAGGHSPVCLQPRGLLSTGIVCRRGGCGRRWCMHGGTPSVRVGVVMREMGVWA
jgi:hypothetical protein